MDSGSNMSGISALLIKRPTQNMRLLFAILGSLFLLAVAAFCVFGFLATFEPINDPRQVLAFRVGYVAVGTGCVVGLILLFVNVVRK